MTLRFKETTAPVVFLRALRYLRVSKFFSFPTAEVHNMEMEHITSAIIGAAIEVHRRLGPGLLESAYRVCLAYELRKRGFAVVEEQPVPVIYDEVKLECGFRADLIVDGVVVELKAKSAIHPVDKAQVLSHLKLLNKPVGLLINFHELKLIDGVHRILNTHQ